MEENFPMTVAYDIKRKQVGCALLQPVYGGTIDGFSLQRFNNWLVAPTDDLKPYRLENKEQLEKLIKITNTYHPKA